MKANLLNKKDLPYFPAHAVLSDISQEAIFELGKSCYAEKQDLKWIKQATNQGYRPAIAWIYRLIRFETKQGNVVQVFKIAHEMTVDCQLLPLIAACLGDCYLHGKGTTVDLIQAEKYLNLAAELLTRRSAGQQ